MTAPNDARTAHGQAGTTEKRWPTATGMLGEIAIEAGIERTTFLDDAARPAAPIPARRTRTASTKLGGMVLHRRRPGLPRRSRPMARSAPAAAYQDEETGEWRTETEVIESAAELVELYNPAEMYAAFAEAARERGRPARRADGDRRTCWRVSGIASEEWRRRRHRRQRPDTSARPTTGPRPRTTGRAGRRRATPRGACTTWR